MKDENNIAEIVKSVAKSKKPAPIIEIDKTGPIVHVTIPEYNGFMHLYLNDKRLPGLYRVVEGKASIQLSGALPREYRFRAEVLTKKE